MTVEEFQTIRTTLAYRLLGLTPTYIAGQLGISLKAVQGILLTFGSVEKRGSRRYWRGKFSITSETHKRLRLPNYIPLSVDKAGGPIPLSTGWMAVTKDAPVIVMRDGSRMLHTFDGEPVEPFHPSQGFDASPPSD